MKVKITQLHPTLCDPMNLYSPWNSPGQNAGVGNRSLFQGIFTTQESNQVSCIEADSLPGEPQGKPKNTGMGSLSLLQQSFPTPESHCGLLHCRWILYQLSYQGIPYGETACWFSFTLRTVGAHLHAEGEGTAGTAGGRVLE